MIFPSLIGKEAYLSMKHRLDTTVYRGQTLVCLTPSNVGKVEAMIATDSAYRRAGDETAAPVYKRTGNQVYGGSSAYWMARLRPAIDSPDKLPDVQYREILSGAVDAVDRENSTHLNADGCGRDELLGRLLRWNRKKLAESLKERDFSLYDDLFRATHPTAVYKNGKKAGQTLPARENIAFASKFCHYACLYLFRPYPEADNFSIWDNVLRENLPSYLEMYKIPVPDMYNYRAYSDAVDRLRTHEDLIPISRNGLDHLIWYYHKGEF